MIISFKSFFKWVFFILLGVFILLLSSILITNVILKNNQKSNIKFQSKRPFISKIVKKITNNIQYKNNIEGEVYIHFELYKNGVVKIVKLEGNNVFFPIIQESLKKVSPIKLENKNMIFPQKFSVKILFHLNDEITQSKF